MNEENPGTEYELEDLLTNGMVYYFRFQRNPMYIYLYGAWTCDGDPELVWWGDVRIAFECIAMRLEPFEIEPLPRYL